MTARFCERPPTLELSRAERQNIFHLKADIAVRDEVLQSLRINATGELRSCLPAVSELAAELGFRGSVEPFAAGSYHLVYRVITPGSSPVVFRVTRAGLFTRDFGLLAESWARAWLNPVRLTNLVTATVACGFRTAGAPLDYAVLAWADDPSLGDLGDATLDTEPAYLFSLGEVLHSLHTVEGHGAGLIDFDRDGPGRHPIGVHLHWADYILLRLEQHVDVCRQAGLLDGDQSERILHYFEILTPALSDRPLRLLHGDPGIHNLCVERKRHEIRILLDWEDALVGDPLFELAMVSSFQPPRRMPQFLAGYGLPVPSPDDARLIALYFLRIALSKTVHRLRFAMADLPGRTMGHYRLYRGLAELERLL